MKYCFIILLALFLTGCQKPRIEPETEISLEDRLYYNISKKRSMMISGILQMGVNVNSFSENGYTPLTYAVLNLQFGLPLTVVKELIDSGAEPDLAAEGGKTPLIFAAGIGHIPAMELLLSYGADINFNRNGTALMEAAYLGNKNSLSFLLASGADRSIKRSDGETALSLAESRELVEIVSILKNYN